MDAFIPLVIGVPAALGFVVLGLEVFVLGKPSPSRPVELRSHVSGEEAEKHFLPQRPRERPLAPAIGTRQKSYVRSCQEEAEKHFLLR
jgi:hypothetical protein